ncbi:hypothetical protein ASG67_10445 [Sphingomonas sp. Leaf339]|uniref:hypothetical protein n=1 Tax=Sphingomonas sp. Leaf339 TaxID=1736343 RepID=UPI0006FF0FDE|nr:hypothetical protein [Sphingomonas sp. Leaf339]KQU53219.1 hypothetical protein ASG67_10445 [Sphingomonas sp. Leaf339]
MNIGNILKAIVKVAKANPMLVAGALAAGKSAVSAGKQIVKAVKDEAKKPASVEVLANGLRLNGNTKIEGDLTVAGSKSMTDRPSA